MHSLGFDLLHQYDPALAGIIVPVELKVGDREVRILDSRLDTGATHCLFKREYGELLGLPVDSGIQKVFGTAEGTFTGFGHEVSMCAFGFEFNATVYFANFRYPRNVLGRYGWLQQMRIGIVDYEGKLFVARYGEDN